MDVNHPTGTNSKAEALTLRYGDMTEAATMSAELEQLGYSALWLRRVRAVALHYVFWRS